jgi:hypothetical protein
LIESLAVPSDDIINGGKSSSTPPPIIIRTTIEWQSLVGGTNLSRLAFLLASTSATKNLQHLSAQLTVRRKLIMQDNRAHSISSRDYGHTMAFYQFG